MNRRTFASVAAAAALVAFAAVPALAAAPTPAPDFVLDSNTGKPIKLSQYKGKVVMINFWATWCGPCRQEWPLLESIYKQYKDKDFVLLGVNVEPDTKPAGEWLKKQPATFPVLYDVKSEVSGAYKVVGMPTTVWVDKKGFLRATHQSYKPGDENEYMNNIRMLMREK
jgi:thiol-disulfide isomerase/thioredoxin